MKSPYTGKEMKRIYEKRTWKFRGEEFHYHHTSWRCEDTGEQFTTDEFDTAGYTQVTNQYREKYGIPYTDEIINTRERYGVSAARMSQILGIGTNQYRLYEQGEVPSVSNGRMIRTVMNPKVMLDMVESCRNELTPHEYEKISTKVKSSIAASEDYKLMLYERDRVFSVHRGIENGFSQTSLSRLKNIMLCVLERCQDVWFTKMNKLLFYIDFLSYRERGFAMTGLSYRAIEFGPVPERWDRVYSEFPEVEQELQQVGEFVGSVLHSNTAPEDGVLSGDDMKIINAVCSSLGNKSSREMSNISHGEDAWMNHLASHGRIPFSEAFSLKAV